VRGAQSRSLREVADRAGVAMSSVSRVLSGHPDVSPAMRTRVMAVVDELGYEPNLLAASLRRGATMTVALAVGDVSDPAEAGVALGAESRLREAGYTMLLTSSEGSSELEARQISVFRRRRVDGLLLALCDESGPGTLEEIERLTAPCVLIDRELGGAPGASAVLCDHAAGIAAAAGHLHGLGHRRIALIAGSTGVRPGRERTRAFADACAGLGVEAVVESGALDARLGHDAAVRALARSPRPTAIVSGSPAILAGVLGAVREHGLRIPADVSLVTCDHVPMLELVDPQVAVVTRDPIAIGREAARMLLGRIAGDPPATARIPTQFDARASCGPAPGS
jgi:LacI family transcriptional regulator, galactose operon repressor